MALLNRSILIGRLTRDPELRYTPQGVPVASFSLAVERPFTNQAGQRETDFIDCVAWRKLAETVGNHLTKGRLAAVEGRLQIRSYDAQDGTKRRVAEVIADSVQFLDRPKDGTGSPAPSATASDAASEPTPDDPTDALPDDLPF
jgi:single-strand DNA-binding protein